MKQLFLERKQEYFQKEAFERIKAFFGDRRSTDRRGISRGTSHREAKVADEFCIIRHPTLIERKMDDVSFGIECCFFPKL